MYAIFMKDGGRVVIEHLQVYHFQSAALHRHDNFCYQASRDLLIINHRLSAYSLASKSSYAETCFTSSDVNLQFQGEVRRGIQKCSYPRQKNCLRLLSRSRRDCTLSEMAHTIEMDHTDVRSATSNFVRPETREYGSMSTVGSGRGLITDIRAGNKATRVSQIELVFLTLVAFAVFTFAWKITNGGYRCSLLLFTFLFVYVCSKRGLQSLRISNIYHNIKENIVHIAQEERRSLALLLMYTATKAGIQLCLPSYEDSNGSPLSLILFTVYFIMMFVLPPIGTAAWRAATHITNCQYHRGKIPKGLLQHVNRDFFQVWKTSIVLTLITVALSYVFDGDLTSIMRYLAHGTSCWPLLVPKSQQDSLPYPLKYAWIQKWHQIFHDYEPSTFIRDIVILGREMEVIHLLPMLIGIYVLAQVLLPKENWVIKKVSFGCISSVVLSGAISGCLKILLHRYRPNAYGNPYMWTGPRATTVNHIAFSKLDLSFPCGHTTVSMSIASCLYLGVMYSLGPRLSAVKLKVFLVVFIYSYPMVVLFSRVSECCHWTSDAIFGVSYNNSHTLLLVTHILTL